MSRGASAVCSVAAACFAVCQLAFIHSKPGVYMDELFHIKQTQQYCSGEFEQWDAKITTLPGLYLTAALAYVPALKGLHLTGDPCGVLQLRLLNALYALGTLGVLTRLLSLRMGSADAWAHAATLWLYPPSFFFTFLFYTDPGATFFVLLSYLLAQPSQSSSSSKLNSRSSHFYKLIGSAAAGCVAVLFRQTNALWCAFTLAEAVLHDVCTHSKYHTVAAAAAAAKKSDDTTVTTGDTAVSTVLEGPVSFSTVIQFAGAIVTDLRGILQRLWPLLVPVLSFAVFLAKNGSIVVGDKQHHSSVVHLAQLFYAAAAASAMYTSPLVNDGLISTANMKQFLTYTQQQFATVRSAVASCAVLTLAAAALAYSSKAHPFLLADNRHYTFYIWQRWLGKGAVYRCALLPVYVYTAWSVLHRLCTVRSQLWTLMLVCVTAAVLVPAELLEVRYFTVPVLLVQLNSPQRSHAALLSTALACAAVNVLLVYVFLYKSFTWPDGTLARFIW